MEKMTAFSQLRDLMIENRSYRRFDQSKKIGEDILKSLVELTRYCPSGRNLQPLKYRIVDDAAECARLFPVLKWAGYFADWDGPEEGERPVAYLVQCLDTELTTNLLCDDGLQLEALTLGASSLGIHGTIIKSFDVVKTKEILNLPEIFKPLYIVALGYPAETVVIEDTDGTKEADIKYHRDAEGVHIVPKRPLEELLLPQTL